MIKNNFKDRTKLKVILNEVISKFDTDIRTKRRNRSLVYARAVYYRLCKDLTSHSLAEIGSCLRKDHAQTCLLYTSPSPRDRQKSRMPSSA